MIRDLPNSPLSCVSMPSIKNEIVVLVVEVQLKVNVSPCSTTVKSGVGRRARKEMRIMRLTPGKGMCRGEGVEGGGRRREGREGGRGEGREGGRGEGRGGEGEEGAREGEEDTSYSLSLMTCTVSRAVRAPPSALTIAVKLARGLI